MSGTKPTVLVTGGAGYIGSHAALALRQRGYSPIVLDNLSKGHRVVVERDLGLPLIVGDAADRGLLGEIFEEHDVVAIMHFAA
ncbi:NAD-dependent epimerase/dehydratase family protein, partial [bacterium]|nr:NAD-dependent epimerase/dehydratase family protein [bacterium]